MRIKSMILMAAMGLSLGACARKAPLAEAPPPPLPPGAIPGSVMADRDGDGVIDGYYTPDGVYHRLAPAAPPPPPPAPTKRGERG